MKALKAAGSSRKFSISRLMIQYGSNISVFLVVSRKEEGKLAAAAIFLNSIFASAYINSMSQPAVEYWLRGPVEGIPALLQPAAHALLQARDEVRAALQDFPDEKLWEKPAGAASVGFHLQHLRGVLDRLFTYAKDEPLSQVQLEALANEGKPYDGNPYSTCINEGLSSAGRIIAAAIENNR
ncbi:MAG: hypothetical protein WDO16_25115 [Bacteroidota bacterium]